MTQDQALFSRGWYGGGGAVVETVSAPYPWVATITEDDFGSEYSADTFDAIIISED